MKTLILVLMFCIISPSWGQDEEGTNIDYNAMTKSLLYLNKVWVDEPAQRQNNIDVQRAAPNPYLVPQAPHVEKPIPTCIQIPVYSQLDGSILTYHTQCY